MTKKEITEAYNVIVGALDHSVKQGTFDLQEISQFLPALGKLTQYIEDIKE